MGKILKNNMALVFDSYVTLDKSPYLPIFDSLNEKQK